MKLEFNENAEELLTTLKRIGKLMKSDYFLEKLSFNEIFICRILVEMEESGYKDAKIQLKDLSDRLRISRPALNNIINKLEEKELVERFRLQGDRKSVYVKLTPNHHAIYHKEKEKIIKVMNLIVDKLGHDDSETFIILLNKLYEIIEMEGSQC